MSPDGVRRASPRTGAPSRSPPRTPRGSSPSGFARSTRSRAPAPGDAGRAAPVLVSGRPLRWVLRQRQAEEGSIAGGAPESICDAGDGRGATWSENGTIVFAPESAGGLYRVPQGGGELRPVTELDASRKETGHRWPSLPPRRKALPLRDDARLITESSTSSSARSTARSARSSSRPAAHRSTPRPAGSSIPRRTRVACPAHRPAEASSSVGETMSLGEAPAPSDWSGRR